MRRWLVGAMGGVVTSAAAVLDQSFAGASFASYLQFDGSVAGGGGGILGGGQSFTSGGGTLDSCKFAMWKSGSPTGNITAKLWASTGAVGSKVATGAALASSDVVVATTLGTVEPTAAVPQLITFNFSGANRYAMVAATTYIIYVEYTGTPTDMVRLEGDGSSTDANGNACYQGFFSNFALPGFLDVAYYVYKV
jgi:hypothetical protein